MQCPILWRACMRMRPPAGKSRLLEPLLRPLGLLSLFALADGAFARIWLRNGASELRVSPDDAQEPARQKAAKRNVRKTSAVW